MKKSITIFILLFFMGSINAYCQRDYEKISRVFPEYEFRGVNLSKFGATYDAMDDKLEYANVTANFIFYAYVQSGSNLDDIQYEVFSQLMLHPSHVLVSNEGDRVCISVIFTLPGVYTIGNQWVICRTEGDSRTLDDFPD